MIYSVRAHLFLRSGATSAFANVPWPAPTTTAPGQWVTADPGSKGASVSACRDADLPYWVSDELWEIELAEPVTPQATRVSASRGRLMQQIVRWDTVVANHFMVDAVLHSRNAVAALLRDAAAETLRPLGTMDALIGALAGANTADEFCGLDAKGDGAALRLVCEAANDGRLGFLPLALHEAALAVGMAKAGGVSGDIDAFETAVRTERMWQADALTRLVGINAH